MTRLVFRRDDLSSGYRKLIFEFRRYKRGWILVTASSMDRQQLEIISDIAVCVAWLDMVCTKTVVARS